MRKNDFKTVPLGQVKGLPIGVPGDDGKLHRHLKLNDWVWDKEEEISKFINDHPEFTVSRIVTEIMTKMISVYGPYSFDEIDNAEKLLRLRTSYLADVVFAYTKLRFEAMGNEWLQVFVCPGCRSEVKWIGELDSTDVKVCEAETANDLVTPIDLKFPILLGDADTSQIVIRPNLWEVMYNLPGGAGQRDPRVRKMVFEAAIVGANGIEVPGEFLMTEERLKTLKKRDIELLAGLIDEGQGGVDFEIEVSCPNCGTKFRPMSDWSYESFFGSSSLPLD